MTRYVLGNKSTVDIYGVEFSPVPDEAKHNLIRTNGTSLGHKHSGHFKNTKTGTKFIFLLAGKGTQHYFRKDGQPVSVKQVWWAVKNFPDTFVFAEGRIMLLI